MATSIGEYLIKCLIVSCLTEQPTCDILFFVRQAGQLLRSADFGVKVDFQLVVDAVVRTACELKSCSSVGSGCSQSNFGHLGEWCGYHMSAMTGNLLELGKQFHYNENQRRI